MARLGRQWTTADNVLIDYFTKKREESGDPSLRKLAEQTNIRHTRLGDLFNKTNGVPTFDEFIILCESFNVSPVEALTEILNAVHRVDIIYAINGKDDDVASRAVLDYTDLNSSVSQQNTGMVDKFVSDEEVASTINKLLNGGVGVAAYRSEHKYDGDGDDPA